MTVYEQIKNLSVAEMAALLGDMVDHSPGTHVCSCPIGYEGLQENGGYCGWAEKGCDESALAWLKSEEQLKIKPPKYLTDEAGE